MSLPHRYSPSSFSSSLISSFYSLLCALKSTPSRKCTPTSPFCHVLQRKLHLDLPTPFEVFHLLSHSHKLVSVPFYMYVTQDRFCNPNTSPGRPLIRTFPQDLYLPSVPLRTLNYSLTSSTPHSNFQTNNLSHRYNNLNTRSF